MKMMTLKELNNIEEIKIFSEVLDNFDIVPHFIEDFEESLGFMDEDFIIRGFEKIVSPYIHLYRELYPNDWRDRFGYILEAKYREKWNKMYEALITEYKPLDNYFMKEKTTPRTSITMSATSNGENDIYAFNSVDESPSTKASLTNTSVSSTSGTIELERSGNIGVTTSAQMLSQEIDVRIKNIMYNYICDDLYREMTLSIY